MSEHVSPHKPGEIVTVKTDPKTGEQYALVPDAQNTPDTVEIQHREPLAGQDTFLDTDGNVMRATVEDNPDEVSVTTLEVVRANPHTRNRMRSAGGTAVRRAISRGVNFKQ